MKELSIEQKAKRYDEILARAKDANMPYYKEDIMLKVKEFVDYLIPELKESEDERIRKAIIDTLNRVDQRIIEINYGIKHKDAIAWLEKQGEQKSADKIEPKFNFSVGQWIVATGKFVYLITKIDGFNVTLVGVHGDEYVFDASSLEDAHLWAIQDAKDGDVLVDEDNNIGIYKEIEDICWHSYIYLGCDNCLYGFSAGGYHMQNNTKPATKEQRDTLFTKMKEAGYEWDAEKKKLKKIEEPGNFKNQVMSEITDLVEDYITHNPAKWSEKDENRINRLIAYFEDKESFSAEDDIVYANWLKSLKGRYTWKPSEEQMNALNYVVNLMASSERPTENDLYYNILKSLREQLKKLKG